MKTATVTRSTRRQSSNDALASLQQHAARLARGDETVRPGMPFRITEAATVGDGVWQGDLGIEVIENIDELGYTPSPVVKQLVPGIHSGARHCLANPQTVTNFVIPDGWNTQTYDELAGPAFRCTDETVIPHPVHGPVSIAAGHSIRLRYQRNWHEEQRKERRALD